MTRRGDKYRVVNGGAARRKAKFSKLKSKIKNCLQLLSGQLNSVSNAKKNNAIGSKLREE